MVTERDRTGTSVMMMMMMMMMILLEFGTVVVAKSINDGGIQSAVSKWFDDDSDR